MQKHTIRNILVGLVLVWGAINVYPTIGWLLLSPEEQEARLAKWRSEDEVYEEPNRVRDLWKGIKRWAEFDRKRVVNLGLDLQGGIHIVLGLEMDKLDPDRRKEYEEMGYPEAMIQEEVQQIALQRIERRIAEFEAQEPIIQTLGNSQIQVQLPGEKDLQRARELVTRTAYLTFNLVVGAEEADRIFASIEENFRGRFLPFCRRAPQRGVLQVTVENAERIRTVLAEAEKAGIIPENRAIRFGPKPRPGEDPFHLLYVIETPELIAGTGLRRAVARPDTQSAGGAWQILFENTAETAGKFGEVTGQHIDRAMAIVVDNVVVSAPTIQARITSSGTITGNFSQVEAQDLAIALQSGSMPVPIREDYVGVVSPSLGREAIDAGIISSVLGVLAVCAFMMFYYRLAGVIANIALVLNALLLLALLSYANATLTLPGIAGLMLTLGMAVDANVLIYERIREELALGKSLAASVESGFTRASTAILDSNVTTLIAAAVLMEFGSGPIEGFAITLSLGIFTSVFTALVCSKVIFDFLLNRRMLSKLTMMSFFKAQTSYPFLSYQRGAIIASLIIIAATLGYFGTRGSNMFGVDFRTGTNLTAKVDTTGTVPVESVRSALASAGFQSPVVQGLGEGETIEANRFLIRLAEVDEAIDAQAQGSTTTDSTAVNTVADRVQAALAPLAGAGSPPEKVILESVQTVGPAVSRQLKLDTVEAVLYSLIFIGIYMWYRFDWRYGLGALVALVHDVAITLGLIAVFQFEISLNVVAAVLTIIGYSLNDTIVVFDRIREDLRLYRGRGYTLAQIMNISINQTLGRTILTSLCTIFVCIVLLLYGGPVLRDFAFVLLVGIIVGTFSSVFIASPMTLFLHKFDFGRRATKDQAEGPRAGGRRYRRRETRDDDEAARAVT